MIPPRWRSERSREAAQAARSGAGLALLLLASYAPETAADFGLLYGPRQAGAGTQEHFDYAVVGSWPAQSALPGPANADFVQMAQAGVTSLGKTYVLGTMVFNSFEAMNLIETVRERDRGTQSGQVSVLVLFSPPVPGGADQP